MNFKLYDGFLSAAAFLKGLHLCAAECALEEEFASEGRTAAWGICFDMGGCITRNAEDKVDWNSNTEALGAYRLHRRI